MGCVDEAAGNPMKKQRHERSFSHERVLPILLVVRGKVIRQQSDEHCLTFKSLLNAANRVRHKLPPLGGESRSHDGIVGLLYTSLDSELEKYQYGRGQLVWGTPERDRMNNKIATLKGEGGTHLHKIERKSRHEQEMVRGRRGRHVASPCRSGEKGCEGIYHNDCSADTVWQSHNGRKERGVATKVFGHNTTPTI
jgi:hypothetical protein